MAAGKRRVLSQFGSDLQCSQVQSGGSAYVLVSCLKRS
jgi:hypothetical protein